ncbi:sensor histidine kinase [Agathobacter sp.]|uniref:sensor histidine kinase n=1 Tax=Agathobacter sp. TaxID=2021311 RepID=UPI003FD7146A
MKKISRNPWLKLAAFIVCSVVAAGLVVTTIVAVYTNNHQSTAQLRDEIHANIAAAYSRQMVYNYESGDDNAFSQMMDDTNLKAAVVKSNETSEDKVDVKSDAAKVYSSVDEISNPDYIFSYKAKNLKWNRLSNVWDAMSGIYKESEATSNDMNSEKISSIMYSKTNGLFYLCLNDGTAYVIPKVKVMTGSDDNSSLGSYKAVEKTDENGNNYFAYEETFTGQPLDITGFAEWKNVKCYDEKGNHIKCGMNLSDDGESYSDGSYYDYKGDIYYDRYEIIKVVEQVNESYELLPDSFKISDTGIVYYPYTQTEDKPGYYYVYAKLPLKLQAKGDYFNQADSLLDIMEFTEAHLSVLFVVFILGFVITAGYLLVVAGKRAESEEIKLRLYDRLPYGVMLGVTMLADSMVFPAGFLLIKQLPAVALICLAATMVSLEAVLSTYVRIRAHEFWKHTLCYCVLRFLLKPVKKLCRMVFGPIRYGFSWIERNVPLFLISMLAFGFLCLLELIGFGMELIGFVFIIKIIELALLITFIMQYDRIRCAAKAIANGDFSHPVDTSRLMLFFRKHGEDLNNVSNGIEAAVSEKMKSERFRTELITNVSHDIKTPLTSIINYVDLLQKEDIDNEKVREYLDVLDRQSSRLKKLIQDLLEASKASTGSINVELEELDAAVMLSQVAGEYEEKFKKNNLNLIIKNDVTPVMIQADGRHLWRVFDNLMSNINKYAQPGTRVYIDIIPKDGGAIITFKNVSATPLNISSDELKERFVRGDSSRNTEGSGLGLSIAESLMKLMNGTLELTVDGDLFKVTLEF